jgi:hypothetical protein
MVLVFPTILTSPKEEKVKYLRSFNREKFNRDLKRLVADGWEVHHVTSSFRKTAWGGTVSYFGELRSKD